MGIEYQTCHSIRSRQSLGDGSGKIMVPANYCDDEDHCPDNDSCNDVDIYDCPTGYKIITGNTPFFDYGRRRTDGEQVPVHNMREYGCWRGRNTRGYGANAVLGINHGLPSRRMVQLSGESGGLNNYSKVCLKDNDGWLRTDPTTGLKFPGGARMDERHKNYCCGFIEPTDGNVQNHYCHPDYCHSSSDGNIISPECRNQLKNLCSSWGNEGGLIGFENEKCASGKAQIAKENNESISNLSGVELINAENRSSSLSREDYGNIGDQLCTKGMFTLPSEDTSPTDIKRHEKCLQWCGDNGGICKPKIKSFCEDIYRATKQYPEVFPDDINNYQKICSCNWPDEFYENVNSFFKEQYNVPDSELSTDRKCIFAPCHSNPYNISNEDDSRTECRSNQYVSCIQNLDFDFQGATVNESSINTDQTQECDIENEEISTSPTNTGGGDSDGDDDGDDIFIVLIPIIIIAIAVGGYYYYSNNEK